MDYIDRLRIARKQKNLKQTEISLALGLASAAYGLYETRKRKMDIETLVKVCRLLDVTPNEVLGFSEKE